MAVTGLFMWKLRCVAEKFLFHFCFLLESYHLQTFWKFWINWPQKLFKFGAFRYSFRDSKMLSSPYRREQLRAVHMPATHISCIALQSGCRPSLGQLVRFLCSPVVMSNTSNWSLREGSFCNYHHRAAEFVCLLPAIKVVPWSHISLKPVLLSSFEKNWLSVESNQTAYCN